MGIAARTFEEEVAMLAGMDFARGLLRVREDTPGALVSLGVPDLPMIHTRAHAISEMAPGGWQGDGHGVDPSLLAALPRLLEDPVAVIESNSREGVLMVVLDASAGPHDEPLTAVIDPGVPLIGARDGGERVNFVLSVYGRAQVIREVPDAVGRGEALLYDGPRFWSVASRCRRLPGASCAAPPRAPMAHDGTDWGKMGARRGGRRP